LGGALEGEETAPAAKRKKGQAVARGPELFNLAADPGEKTNLAAENPEKTKKLLERYEAYLRQAAKVGNQPRPADFKAPRVWGEADSGAR
jgi:hypothetical protein